MNYTLRATQVPSSILINIILIMKLITNTEWNEVMREDAEKVRFINGI